MKLFKLAKLLYFWEEKSSPVLISKNQKQPSRGVLRKMGSENMQQIYGRTPVPKSDFNKVALQLYWNLTSAWVFSCKFAAYFRIPFPKNTLGRLLLKNCNQQILKDIFLKFITSEFKAKFLIFQCSECLTENKRVWKIKKLAANNFISH